MTAAQTVRCPRERGRGRRHSWLRPLLLALLAGAVAGCTVHLHLSERQYVYHDPPASQPSALDN